MSRILLTRLESCVTMCHIMTKQPKPKTTAQVRMPAELAERLTALAEQNGMSVVGMFRAHGDQIVHLIFGTKPRRKPAAAS